MKMLHFFHSTIINVINNMNSVIKVGEMRILRVTMSSFWLKKRVEEQRPTAYPELPNPRNWSASFATELARLSAASWTDASAYIRMTSSVPDGRMNDRPRGYFAEQK